MKADLEKKVNEIIKNFPNLNKIYNSLYEYDPAMYLYGQLIERLRKNELAKLLEEEQFIELLYITLKSWGMNIRRAKLKDFNQFHNQIDKNKKEFIKLTNYHILELNERKVKELEPIIKELFKNLDLMESKYNLTCNSKIMHFILPDLIFPINSKIRDFIGYLGDSESGFFKGFSRLYTITLSIAQKIELKEYLNKGKWNLSIPKIIDNVITVFQDKSKEEK